MRTLTESQFKEEHLVYVPGTCLSVEGLRTATVVWPVLLERGLSGSTNDVKVCDRASRDLSASSAGLVHRGPLMRCERIRIPPKLQLLSKLGVKVQ